MRIGLLVSQRIPDLKGMNPDRTDAAFILTTGLAASKFLLERIEHYITTIL